MAHAHEESPSPEESYRPAVTVDILPDDVFREIFAFCLPDRNWNPITHMEEWQRLVQVCRRWRQIIYGSPHYLDLHLHCVPQETPFRRESHHMSFRKSLSRWPEFPLTVDFAIHREDDDDNLLAALEHPNRVHRLNLLITSWDSGVFEVLENMRVSFPALTHLELEGPDTDHDDEVYDFSHNFLGNSAPCLQHLHLDGISFQDLPKLLLSARGLVSLQLERIPAPFYSDLGYISPEAMVGGLAGLTRLRTLCIEFRSPQDLDPPDSNERLEKGRRPPEPPMRVALPALTGFVFSGGSKYLEDLVARIDMPSVEDIKIDYFPLGFEVHQLFQFIGRTASIELAQFRRAQVTFDTSFSHTIIRLDRSQGERHQVRFSLGMQIPESHTRRDSDLDVLVPRMAHVLGHLTALLSNVGYLSFNSQQNGLGKTSDMDNSNLLPLLRLFPTVEELHVSGPLAGHIATVLENIAEERVTELMPALHSLWLGNGDKPVGSTERFLSLRRLSGRPVTVRNTEDQAEDEFDEGYLLA